VSNVYIVVILNCNCRDQRLKNHDITASYLLEITTKRFQRVVRVTDILIGIII